MQLQFLEFTPHPEGDTHTTWEAMASVRAPQREALRTELQALWEALPRWLGGSAVPLDDGGDWDLWVQLQWEGQAPQTLAWPPGNEAWRAFDEAPRAEWLTLTVTLSVTEGLAPVLAQRWGD